jgi:DNA (cytosine-5)-methyltransferase 1
MVLENYYRIRKLIPRECGRLMDVSDEDITKMESVNSNSQLYKQFGNSIVVGVMVAMFKNLHIDQRQPHG